MHFRILLPCCFTILFSAIGTSLSAQTNFDPWEGLVAYYPFSGNANDATTNAIDGTISNGSFAPDRFSNPGSAIRFTGARNPESNVKFPAADGRLNLTNDFTVSVWAKLEGGTEGPRIVSTAGFELTFENPNQSSNGVNFNNSFADGSFAAAFSTNDFPKGVWYQIVGRRLGNSLAVFVNGRLEGEAIANLPQSYLRGFTPEIGGNSGIDADAFGGLIDEVRFYNRPLADAEIAALYQLETAPPPETLSIRVKTVRVTLGLVVGKAYQLESSSDLVAWNTVGPSFVATAALLEQDFDADTHGQYFRLNRLP